MAGRTKDTIAFEGVDTHAEGDLVLSGWGMPFLMDWTFWGFPANGAGHALENQPDVSVTNAAFEDGFGYAAGEPSTLSGHETGEGDAALASDGVHVGLPNSQSSDLSGKLASRDIDTSPATIETSSPGIEIATHHDAPADNAFSLSSHKSGSVFSRSSGTYETTVRIDGSFVPTPLATAPPPEDYLPATGKPIYNNTQIIGQIDSGWQWSGTTVTYGFPTVVEQWVYDYNMGYDAGFSQFSPYQQQRAIQVMELWDDLVAVNFEYTADGDNAQVQFNNTTTGVSYAVTFFPSGGDWGGTIWMNPNSSGSNSLTDPDPGEFGFQTFIHESGHALGLSHPGPYDGGGTYANDAVYAQDTRQYSVMSYFSSSITGADWNGGNAQTPMVHDILTLQDIYGVDLTTRTGDTVYGFNSTVGDDIYDFSINANPVLTIYDAGGIDTLDLSGYASDATIDLTPGGYTSAGGTPSNPMQYNIGIAFTAVIENAIAGSGNDTVYGNDADNLVDGMSGNDELYGGLGNDTLYGGNGADTLSGDSGNDWLYGYAGDDTLNGGADTDALFGEDGNDILNGGAGGDSLDGGFGADTLNGDAGVDWLFGSFGNDTLNGGGDTDALFGQEDDDIINGGSGDDSLDGGTGNDTLNGDAGVDWLYGGAGNDVLHGGTETDALFGQGGADQLYGDDGGDSLDGGDDNDYLSGGTGVDWLYGGAGDDTLDGGADTDALFGQAGNDTINGGDTGDSLDGGSGNDTLNGDGGNDFLYGGAGADIFTGGTGADMFFYANTLEGGDTITDFLSGTDQLHFSATGFGFAGPGPLDPSLFETGTGIPTNFLATQEMFYYETGLNALWYDPTGGTSSDALLIADLDTGFITDSDILIA